MKQNNKRYKINKIVNKLLLAGDKLIPEMHLSLNLHIVLVDNLQKNKERIQKFRETGDSQYIYQNELDKACFQHDMAYGDFKDLTKRITFDKILRDKAFNIAKNPKYNGYEKGLALMIYKKTAGFL